MVLEECLRESPYFAGAGAGASSPRDQPDSYSSAAADASAASAAVGALGTSPAAGSGISATGAQSTALASALALARNERTALLDAISDCAVRNMPQDEQLLQQQQLGEEGPGSWCWDEQLMAGMRELNSLRRHLGVNVLRWSGKLQDLPGFNRAHSAGGVHPVAGARYRYCAACEVLLSTRPKLGCGQDVAAMLTSCHGRRIGVTTVQLHVVLGLNPAFLLLVLCCRSARAPRSPAGASAAAAGRHAQPIRRQPADRCASDPGCSSGSCRDRRRVSAARHAGAACHLH